MILGEQHHANGPMRSTEPRWLTIPERGLYTGMAIVGAVGTGKTSARSYPYAEQLLGFAAGDEARKLSALILEVKGGLLPPRAGHLRAPRACRGLRRGQPR